MNRQEKRNEKQKIHKDTINQNSKKGHPPKRAKE